MSFDFKAGSFAVNTVTGNQSVAGVGFQPKAILFLFQAETADGFTEATGRVGWLGMAISSSSRAGIAFANTARRHVNTKCITFINGASTLQAEADLVSFDSDGFTINWTTAFGTAAIVTYIAMGGSDLSNVFIKELTSEIATGNKGYTGIGFQPDALMVISAGYSTAPDSTASIGRNGFGFGKSSINRATLSMANDSVNYKRKQLTDHIISVIDASPTTFIEADLVSLDSDGFTLNWTTVQGTPQYAWVLCLKGGQYSMKSFNQPAVTGNQSITGIGFQPSGVIFAGFNDVSSTSIQDTIKNFIGAANSNSSRWSRWAGQDPSVSSSDGTRLNRSACILHHTKIAGSDSTQAEADFVSNDPDGFTVNWTAADGTAREVLAMCFGNTFDQRGFPYIPIEKPVLAKTHQQRYPFSFAPPSISILESEISKYGWHPNFYDNPVLRKRNAWAYQVACSDQLFNIPITNIIHSHVYKIARFGKTGINQVNF